MCISVCACVYTYMCVYIYVYIYIYILFVYTPPPGTIYYLCYLNTNKSLVQTLDSGADFQRFGHKEVWIGHREGPKVTFKYAKSHWPRWRARMGGIRGTNKHTSIAMPP